ncbi:uncharacterized protein BDZ99DRAFT_574587 [Mytilinidion resinicola]|uniref:non-specific serine/threonine protein kinase n=1 Tax=Mytilinidion resinicola TaxID=574789 RepID=A0A6A6YCG2_9PEZI|nr:uncharacterized protein BDZ99DRAFT_574587 [Mytilinidion resinicola]KAF2805714.1 hypothetical protein BDZ99DRAFT_574587 [Mytilinidion resinicola]
METTEDYSENVGRSPSSNSLEHSWVPPSYKIRFSDDMEDTEDYIVGGFHPVHLGDLLYHGQYGVMHKLGHGGLATVWLCRDLQMSNYVAVKIMIADESHFRPANILLQVTNIDHLSEDEVMEELGEPLLEYVETTSGEDPAPTAPEYQVATVAWHKVNRQLFKDQIAIVDFGESFETSGPPKGLATPSAYCAPELLMYFPRRPIA